MHNSIIGTCIVTSVVGMAMVTKYCTTNTNLTLHGMSSTLIVIIHVPNELGRCLISQINTSHQQTHSSGLSQLGPLSWRMRSRLVVLLLSLLILSCESLVAPECPGTHAHVAKRSTVTKTHVGRAAALELP